MTPTHRGFHELSRLKDTYSYVEFEGTGDAILTSAQVEDVQSAVNEKHLIDVVWSALQRVLCDNTLRDLFDTQEKQWLKPTAVFGQF